MTDPMSKPWFVVVDDLIGGFAVSNVDKPTSEIDRPDLVITDFIDEAAARHVVELHNSWLERQQ